MTDRKNNTNGDVKPAGVNPGYAMFHIAKANLYLPLVDEVAADIFMGEFSQAFRESAQVAAQIVDRTLYAKYYTIDFNEFRALLGKKRQATVEWNLFQKQSNEVDEFAQLCATRAGVELGTWDPATNGMIIEQQQILTTQNLAALFSTLNLTGSLYDQPGEMARECFVWICRRHQMKIGHYHAWLILVKNSAYAWRQMIFYRESAWNPTVRRFLGWSKSRHWLAPAT